MPVPIGQILMRVTLFQVLDAIECQNIWYIQNRAEVSDIDYPHFPENYITNFNLVVKPDWQAFQVNKLHWNKIRATVVIPPVGPEAEAVYPILEQGALDDDNLPSFCAAVITKRTGFTGRRNRGRWYMVGLGQTDVFQETIQDAEFTRITDFANHWQNLYGPDGTSSQYEHVLYSHKDGDVAGEPTLSGVKQIAQLLPRRVVYTQRHRLVGHGT